MAHKKIMPDQCREIVARVTVGEKQKAVADAFGVSPARILQTLN